MKGSSGTIDCKDGSRTNRLHPYERPNSPLSRIVQCIENMTPINDCDFDLISSDYHPPLHTTDPTTKESNTTTIPSSFCADPIHLHSFDQLSSFTSLIKSKIYNCQICNNRESSFTLLTCLSCGLYVHRTCLSEMKFESNHESSNNIKLLQICPINQEILQRRLVFLKRYGYSPAVSQFDSHNERIVEKKKNERQDALTVTANSISSSEQNNGNQTFDSTKETTEEQSDSVVNGHNDNICFDTSMINENYKIHKEDHDDHDYDIDDDDISVNNKYLWSPQHWALSSPDALRGIKSGAQIRSEKEKIVQSQAKGGQREEEVDLKTTLSNLSKALQENFLIHLMKRPANDSNETNDDEKEGRKEVDSIHDKNDQQENISDKLTPSKEEQNGNSLDSEGSVTGKYIENNPRAMMQIIAQQMSIEAVTKSNQQIIEDTSLQSEGINSEKILEEVKPKEIPNLGTKVKDTVNTINTTVDIVKKAKSTRDSIGIASIAGTLAGGAVGLVVAGPAGAYLGSRIGSIAAGVGILVEGSLRIGVLVAGVKGTMFTVNQLQESIRGEGKNRVLTIGEKGTECKVVLVRPNILVDPIWESITLKIRQSAPKDNQKGVLPALSFLTSNESDVLKQERRKRDSEIVNSEEFEISVREKVFLLVSSSLNDKNSLPGYVYRKLVEELKKRAEDKSAQLTTEDTTSDEPFNALRNVRQDVHAIIKHITATLLEVRPGFASSANITELSASAVESLVFGEVYDLVFDEIIYEAKQKDERLREKIVHDSIKPSDADFICDEAIEALQSLSHQHSVSEKLTCCVKLLESISGQGEMENMSADSLLRIVCQHIVIANIAHLNAECLFLEEFARDEQLLRGREGYALVTLQASLHFLNVCSDLRSDVFEDDQ